MENRIYKFRAWNHTNEKMIYPKQYIIAYDGIPPFIRAIQDFWFMALSHEWVIMQYTGLKDKNGKEIYEGDIVKSMMNFEGRRCKTTTGRIRYKSGSYWIFRTDIDCVLLNSTDEEEVIGNIYENPELLKGEKDGNE